MPTPNQNMFQKLEAALSRARLSEAAWAARYLQLERLVGQMGFSVMYGTDGEPKYLYPANWKENNIDHTEQR